jgi:hypothetical protein
MAVDVIFTMASFGFMIFGSGTLSTRTSFPYQQSAFIAPCSLVSLGLDVPVITAQGAGRPAQANQTGVLAGYSFQLLVLPIAPKARHSFSLTTEGPGTVALTGAGSNLTINGSLFVGSLFVIPDIPAVKIIIQDGGKVSNSFGLVAR